MTGRPEKEPDAGPRWGLVSTVKADASAILGFAAHHLELGCHRLYLYLDTPCPEAEPFLADHPKIRVIQCDAQYWKRRGIQRPAKHQVRQSRNATHAYQRKPEVDWLAHIDADEFLWPADDMANALAAVQKPQNVARVRPAESLGGSFSHFKAFLPNDGKRDTTVAALYPEFGTYVKGGFLSHVVGKIFVRTGLDNVVLRIHRAFIDAAPADGTELSDVDLLHCHVGDWEDWLTAYRYRVEKGSYRAELSPAQPRALGGATLHELFTLLEEEEGISGLRRFYDEVCADTPSLRDRLSGHDLLLHRPLDLAGAINKHFPTWQDCVADRDN